MAFDQGPASSFRAAKPGAKDEFQSQIEELSNRMYTECIQKDLARRLMTAMKKTVSDFI